MGNTHKEKQIYWNKVIEQWKDSDVGMTRFCKENNLCRKSFYRWNKKISNDVFPSTSSFKEVIDQPVEGSGLWFDFGNGARLIIDNEFNQATFKKLMGTLIGC
jgi:hypothetical protein